MTPGLTDFSVGATVGSVVVVVVVVVVSSAGLSLSLLHAAVKPIIAKMAAPPIAAETLRLRSVDAISFGPFPFPSGWILGRRVVRENRVQQSHSVGIWWQKL